MKSLKDLCDDIIFYTLEFIDVKVTKLRRSYIKLNGRVLMFPSMSIYYRLTRLPIGYYFHKLTIHGNNIISEIPENYNIYSLSIYGRNTISKLPERCNIYYLIIDGYNTISMIPEECDIQDLKIMGHNTISKLPKHYKVHHLMITGRDNANYIPTILGIKNLQINQSVTISDGIYSKDVIYKYRCEPHIE
jgi:hypothetical protein